MAEKKADKPEVTLKTQLERQAGVGVHRAVKKLIDIALNRDGKTSVDKQATYCLKIIEMYYGKVAENKTINTNIQIGFDTKMLEIAQKIKELGKSNNNQKVIDVKPKISTNNEESENV